MKNIKKQATIWKRFPKIPFIEANQFGEIRTIDHWTTYKNGRRKLIKGRILRQYNDGRGYMQVSVSVNGKRITLKVHRIVAVCFIPNPNGYPEVNHIDCDRSNNRVDNLEWCTSQYKSLS